MTTVIVSKKYQIVIPKPVRDAPNAKFFAKPIPSFSPPPAFTAPPSGPRMRISRASRAYAISRKPGADAGLADGFRATRLAWKPCGSGTRPSATSCNGWMALQRKRQQSELRDDRPNEGRSNGFHQKPVGQSRDVWTTARISIRLPPPQREAGFCHRRKKASTSRSGTRGDLLARSILSANQACCFT